MRYLTHSHEDTYRLGRKIAQTFQGGEVVCLTGELGAGKTVFTAGVISYFVPKTRVLSPTFIIVRHYDFYHGNIKHIYHTDLYRLADEDINIFREIKEFFHQPETIVIIEWAEKLGIFMPKIRMEMNFIVSGSSDRMITVTKHG
jgi:tRNA threonylcarbamoyladenosine biosynthesis protein TsaE